MIRQITLDPDLRVTAQVIWGSFRTVADDFGLTEENCPTNAAFITYDKLRALVERGIRFYGLFQDGKQIGAVAVEKLNDREYVMEKLAVLPEYRHQGHGRRLVDFVCDTVRAAGGDRVLIGIIDENLVLKQWYLGLGFIMTDIKRYDHLPFTVCLMEKRL